MKLTTRLRIPYVGRKNPQTAFF